jgi:exosortase/archaeosortase family protein
VNGLVLLGLPPPPPPGPLVPTGSELLLTGALLGLGLWRLGRTKAALRFAAAFVASATLYYAAIPEDSEMQRALTARLAGAFAWVRALLLGATGTPASVAGDAIVTADLFWPVLRGCLGLTYLALLAMAAAWWPAPPRRRLAWLAAGLAAHLGLNSLRVTVLYYLWYHGAFVAYELLHAGGGLVFASALLAVWIGLIRPPRAEAPAARGWSTAPAAAV